MSGHPYRQPPAAPSLAARPWWADALAAVLGPERRGLTRCHWYRRAIGGHWETYARGGLPGACWWHDEHWCRRVHAYNDPTWWACEGWPPSDPRPVGWRHKTNAAFGLGFGLLNGALALDHWPALAPIIGVVLGVLVALGGYAVDLVWHVDRVRRERQLGPAAGERSEGR